MGRLSEIAAGIFLMASGYALAYVKSIIFSYFDASNSALPFDYAQIVSWSSTGLYYLGGLLISYAVLRFIAGKTYQAIRHKDGTPEQREITEEQVQERRREYQDRRDSRQDSRRRDRRR